MRRCKRGFEQGRRALPSGALGRWLKTNVVGLLVAALVAVAMTLVLEAATGGTRYGWEPHLRDSLNQLMSTSLARWLGVLGNALWLVPLVVFAAAMCARARKPLEALSFVVGFALSNALLATGWLLWDRPSPQVIQEGANGAIFNSFPSGHTINAIFVFGLLAFLWWRASSRGTERLVAIVVFAALSCTISLSRVIIGAHWPTDVLASWVIGLMLLGTQIVALQRTSSM